MQSILHIPAELVREFRMVVLIEIGCEGNEIANGIDYLELDGQNPAKGRRGTAIAAYRLLTTQLGPLAELLGLEDREQEIAVDVDLGVLGEAVRHILRIEVKRIAERTAESEPKAEGWVAWIGACAEEILTAEERGEDDLKAAA